MLKLTITKERFLEWYFNHGQDQEIEENANSVAKSIIEQLFKTGVGSITVNEIFDGCNLNAIKMYYTVEFDMQTELHDYPISDLNMPYEIKLVD